eukprot:g4998.t1
MLKRRLRVGSGDCGCQADPLIEPDNPLYNPDEPMQLWVARCEHGVRVLNANPFFRTTLGLRGGPAPFFGAPNVYC